MNTITPTASTNASILAIDLAKRKSVVCVLDESTGEFRFTKFDTSRAEMRELIGKKNFRRLHAGDQGVHCRPLEPR